MALDSELDYMPIKVRKRLMYIFTYDGQSIITQNEFMHIMRFWSSFTANDINFDNELDSREIKMLIWLLNNEKPSKALIEREVRIMDTDGSGTIDRIEWVSYLAAPSASMYHIGNADHYDFHMRELFDEMASNGKGAINRSELI